MRLALRSGLRLARRVARPVIHRIRRGVLAIAVGGLRRRRKRLTGRIRAARRG